MRGSYLPPALSAALILVQLDGPELTVAFQASIPIIHTVLAAAFAVCLSVERGQW